MAWLTSVYRVLLLTCIIAHTIGITIDVTGCGTTKGCMRSPSGCAQGACDILVAWTSTGGAVNFEMSGTIDGYISMALGSSNAMDASSVTGCLGTTLAVEQSYNTGHTNALISPIQAGLSSTNIEYTGGVVTCTFTRALTHANTQVFDLNKAYYLLWASGSVSGSSMSQHSTDVASSVTIDFTSTTYVDIVAGASLPGLAVAHSIFMITAWILCTPLGMIIAASFKERGFPVGGEKLCGQKPWFSPPSLPHAHVSLRYRHRLRPHLHRRQEVVDVRHGLG